MLHLISGAVHLALFSNPSSLKQSAVLEPKTGEIPTTDLPMADSMETEMGSTDPDIGTGDRLTVTPSRWRTDIIFTKRKLCSAKKLQKTQILSCDLILNFKLFCLKLFCFYYYFSYLFWRSFPNIIGLTIEEYWQSCNFVLFWYPSFEWNQ